MTVSTTSPGTWPIPRGVSRRAAGAAARGGGHVSSTATAAGRLWRVPRAGGPEERLAAGFVVVGQVQGAALNAPSGGRPRNAFVGGYDKIDYIHVAQFDPLSVGYIDS